MDNAPQMPSTGVRDKERAVFFSKTHFERGLVGPLPIKYDRLNPKFHKCKGQREHFKATPGLTKLLGIIDRVKSGPDKDALSKR